MSYVILGHCCKDASCIQVCPQNCIRPSPGQPEFETVEHLYIDPNTCIDCSACAEACPAGAIKPESALTESERRYAQRNTEYFGNLATAPQVRAAGPEIPLSFGRAEAILRVAVVGAGTAAMYTVRELLTRSSRIRVTVFEQSADIGGLVRTAVRPEHEGIRSMVRLFDIPLADPRVDLRPDTRVGDDVSVSDLRREFDAVVIAFGASRPREFGSSAGPRTHQAIDVLAAANAAAHGGPVRMLTGPTIGIVGGGNVAMDVAASIAERRVGTVSGQPISRLIVLARSSARRPSFTLSALYELAQLDIDLTIDSGGTRLEARSADPLQRLLADSARAASSGRGGRLPVGVMFGMEVTEALEDGGRIRLVTSAQREVTVDSVVWAAGFTCAALAGVPLNEKGTVSQRSGRVVSPDTGVPIEGLYVVGWAKRGAVGGLGDNRRCAAQTVDQIAADSRKSAAI